MVQGKVWGWTRPIFKNNNVEINLIYVKKNCFCSEHYHKHKNNLFFVVRNYDLETLFANKIGAILGRKDKTYQDKFDFRGRDFYDLIWFLKNGIKPNLKRVKQIIKAEQNKTEENK